MKLVIPVVIATLIMSVVGALWIFAPQYLPFHTATGTTGKTAYVAPRADAVRTSRNNSEMSGLGSVQVARADVPGNEVSNNDTVAAEPYPYANDVSADEIRDQEPLIDSDRTGWGDSTEKVSPRLGCVIEPDQATEIGSPVVGVVSSIEFERGQRVKRGWVLARLRANVEVASVEIAKTRTHAAAEVRAAQSNLEFLRQKQHRAEELVELNFVSEQALEEARADTNLAEERLAQAYEQQLVWQRELKLARAQLQNRTIRAPFDGVIVNRYVSVGERIEDEPLFRIIKTDPLRVEIVVPSSMFGTIREGTAVKVMPELPDAPILRAHVTLVDTVIDGASNTFRVRATLPNPDKSLPSGLRCQAELGELPVASARAKSAAVSPVKPDSNAVHNDKALANPAQNNKTPSTALASGEET